MGVYTINVTLNLLLLHVVLTHVTTCNSKSKLFYCEIVAHKFSYLWLWDLHSKILARSATVVDWMQQLCFMTGSVVYTWSLAVVSKGYERCSDLCTKHCPLNMQKHALWFVFICAYDPLKL